MGIGRWFIAKSLKSLGSPPCSKKAAGSHPMWGMICTSFKHLKLCKCLRTFDISKQISVEYGLLIKLSQVHIIWRGQEKHKAITTYESHQNKPMETNMLFLKCVCGGFFPVKWFKAQMTKKSHNESNLVLPSNLPLPENTVSQVPCFFQFSALTQEGPCEIVVMPPAGVLTCSTWIFATPMPR